MEKTIEEKAAPGSLKGLGRLYAYNESDKRFLLPRRQMTGRTFRSWLTPGPVLDQGATPRCVAYAGGKYLLAHPIVNQLPDVAAIYHDCQENDEWDGVDYDGTSVRALMKVFQSRGLITRYEWAFDAQTLLYHLMESGPIVMGTAWHMDMFTPDAKGYIYPTGQLVGGHAYLLVCANTRRKNPDGSTGAVRILNSWGRGWAQNGRAWLRIDDLPQLLEHWGEAAMATEVKRV